MIDLFQRMFGEKFWNNAIIEVTKWAYDTESIKTRKEKYPPQNETSFIKEINSLLQTKFGLSKNHSLPSVFIDTHYEKNDSIENEKFLNETRKLFEFSNKVQPFECKDIKEALTEIKNLTKQIETKNDKIKNLTEEHDFLKKQLEEEKRIRDCDENGWKLDKCKVTSPPQQLLEQGFDMPKFVGFGIGMLIAGKY